MFRRVVISGIFLFSFLSVSAQVDVEFKKAQELYALVDAFYAQPQYHLTMQMKSFKGDGRDNQQDFSRGYIKKNKDLYEVYQMGIYSIQNEDIKLVVDSTERLVALTFPVEPLQSSFSNESYQASQLFMDRLSSEKNGKNTELTINYTEGFDYNKLFLSIGPRGMVNIMQLFFANPINYQDTNYNQQTANAWVEISYQQQAIEQPNYFKHSISSIVKMKGNEYVLSPLFKGFELSDLRYKQ